MPTATINTGPMLVTTGPSTTKPRRRTAAVRNTGNIALRRRSQHVLVIAGDRQKRQKMSRQAIGYSMKIKVWALDSKYYGVCLPAYGHAYCIGSQEITSTSALKTYANKEMFQEIGASTRRKLEVREVINQLQNRYYRLEEEMEGWPEAERDQAIRTESTSWSV